MASKRRRYAPEFKAKVALEAAKGEKTLSQLTNEYGAASVQISQWKRQLLEGMPAVFGRKQEGGMQKHSRPRCIRKSFGSRWSWTG